MINYFLGNNKNLFSQYVVAFLEGRGAVPNFIIHKPTGEHELQFLEDTSYILATLLIQPTTNILSLEEEKVF